jgi:hypothetical protein
MGVPGHHLLTMMNEYGMMKFQRFETFEKKKKIWGEMERMKGRLSLPIILSPS